MRYIGLIDKHMKTPNAWLFFLPQFVHTCISSSCFRVFFYLTLAVILQWHSFLSCCMVSASLHHSLSSLPTVLHSFNRLNRSGSIGASTFLSQVNLFLIVSFSSPENCANVSYALFSTVTLRIR